ncbi:MAG: hypothetical protein JXQ75_21335, partial [Phycisphaerae bacterium]|nr:hypothetical protein [Phycisphaerae bacterium]
RRHYELSLHPTLGILRVKEGSDCFRQPAPISSWGNFRYDFPRHRVFHEDDRDGFSEQLHLLTAIPDPDRRPARRRTRGRRFSGRGRRRRETVGIRFALVLQAVGGRDGQGFGFRIRQVGACVCANDQIMRPA